MKLLSIIGKRPVWQLLAVLYIPFQFALVALLQWLWNTTMPQAFGLNALTYWESFRLIVICWLLKLMFSKTSRDSGRKVA